MEEKSSNQLVSNLWYSMDEVLKLLKPILIAQRSPHEQSERIYKLQNELRIITCVH